MAEPVKCIKCGCEDPAMTTLIQSFAHQDERLDSMDGKLDRLSAGLYGSPEEPQKGLIIRLDRIEQQRNTMVKIMWALFTSIAGLIVSKFWKGD